MIHSHSPSADDPEGASSTQPIDAAAGRLDTVPFTGPVLALHAGEAAAAIIRAVAAVLELDGAAISTSSRASTRTRRRS